MSRHLLDRFLAPVLIFGTIVLAPGRAAHAQAVPEPALTPPPIAVQTPEATPPSIVRKLNSLSERMEMTVNTSRILTLDQKIPQAQVNNPEILQITPLSPNQIQISAKKPGVTQVNLWSDNKQIYTVDVIVQPDARELAEMLKAQFPTASLKVVPVVQQRDDLRLRRPARGSQPRHPHRRGILPEGHQQHHRQRRPAGPLARSRDGGFADEAADVGFRLREADRAEHGHLRSHRSPAGLCQGHGGR